jgi:hypothetical protein
VTQTFNVLFSCVPFGAKISLNQALDTECIEAEPEGERPRAAGGLPACGGPARLWRAQPASGIWLEQ